MQLKQSFLANTAILFLISGILQSILTQGDGNFRQDEVPTWSTFSEQEQHYSNEIPSQNQMVQQNLHEKNKSFRCPICTRRFTHKCVLNHHVMYCRERHYNYS